MKPHRLVLLACVAACFAVAHGCATTKKAAIPTLVGASAGGIALLLIPGAPIIAIPIAAFSAHVANELEDGGNLKDEVRAAVRREIVREAVPYTPPLVKWGALAVALFLAYRFRSYLAGLAYGIVKLSGATIGSNLKAALVGGPHNALRARETVAEVKSRRRYPNRPVSPQNPETFEGAPHSPIYSPGPPTFFSTGRNKVVPVEDFPNEGTPHA